MAFSLSELVIGFLSSVSALVVGDAGIVNKPIDLSGNLKSAAIEGQQTAGPKDGKMDRSQMGRSFSEVGGLKAPPSFGSKSGDLVSSPSYSRKDPKDSQGGSYVGESAVSFGHRVPLQTQITVGQPIEGQSPFGRRSHSSAGRRTSGNESPDTPRSQAMGGSGASSSGSRAGTPDIPGGGRSHRSNAQGPDGVSSSENFAGLSPEEAKALQDELALGAENEPLAQAPIQAETPVQAQTPVVQTITPAQADTPEAPAPVSAPAPIVQAETPIQTEAPVQTPAPVVQAETPFQAAAPVQTPTPVVKAETPVQAEDQLTLEKALHGKEEILSTLSAMEKVILEKEEARLTVEKNILEKGASEKAEIQLNLEKNLLEKEENLSDALLTLRNFDLQKAVVEKGAGEKEKDEILLALEKSVREKDEARSALQVALLETKASEKEKEEIRAALGKNLLEKEEALLTALLALRNLTLEKAVPQKVVAEEEVVKTGLKVEGPQVVSEDVAEDVIVDSKIPVLPEGNDMKVGAKPKGKTFAEIKREREEKAAKAEAAKSKNPTGGNTKPVGNKKVADSGAPKSPISADELQRALTQMKLSRSSSAQRPARTPRTELADSTVKNAAVEEILPLDPVAKIQELERKKQETIGKRDSLQQKLAEATAGLWMLKTQLITVAKSVQKEEEAIAQQDAALEELAEKFGIKKSADIKALKAKGVDLSAYEILERTIEAARKKLNEVSLKEFNTLKQSIKGAQENIITFTDALGASKRIINSAEKDIEKQKRLAEAEKEEASSGKDPVRTKKSTAQVLDLTVFGKAAGLFSNVPESKLRTLQNISKDTELVKKIASLSENQLKVFAQILKATEKEAPGTSLIRVKLNILNAIVSGQPTGDHTVDAIIADRDTGALVSSGDILTSGDPLPILESPKKTVKELEKAIEKSKVELSLAKGTKFAEKRAALEKVIEEKTAELEARKKETVAEVVSTIPSLSLMPEFVELTKETLEVDKAIEEAEEKVRTAKSLEKQKQVELDGLKLKAKEAEAEAFEAMEALKLQLATAVDKEAVNKLIATEEKRARAAELARFREERKVVNELEAAKKTLKSTAILEKENKAKSFDLLIQTKETEKRILEEKIAEIQNEKMTKEQQKNGLLEKIAELETLKSTIVGVVNKQPYTLKINALVDELQDLEKVIAVDAREEMNLEQKLFYAERYIEQKSKDKEVLLNPIVAESTKGDVLEAMAEQFVKTPTKHLESKKPIVVEALDFEQDFDDEEEVKVEVEVKKEKPEEKVEEKVASSKPTVSVETPEETVTRLQNQLTALKITGGSDNEKRQVGAELLKTLKALKDIASDERIGLIDKKQQMAAQRKFVDLSNQVKALESDTDVFSTTTSSSFQPTVEKKEEEKEVKLNLTDLLKQGLQRRPGHGHSSESDDDDEW